jgi:Sulfotransferase family
MVHHIQPAAVCYHMGFSSRVETRQILAQTHGAAIRYCEAQMWGDSSNKLIWVIDALNDLFPNARFVHLVRDGRKVASSYFHKLANECYDDRSTGILARYIDAYPDLPAPPPEKRYWWPQPRRGSAERETFLAFSQFERIAWHWAEAHRTGLSHLDAIAPERQLFVRLEDLVADISEVRRLTSFLGLPDRADTLVTLARPHNVNLPQDHLLTAEQAKAFDAIAGGMMQTLGYANRPEYAVNY